MATKTLQLRKVPEEIDKIIKQQQGKLLQGKNVLYSKEHIIYQIIREWNGGTNTTKSN